MVAAIMIVYQKAGSISKKTVLTDTHRDQAQCSTRAVPAENSLCDNVG